MIPFWFPKGMKNDDFVDAILFSKNMDPNLSKTVPGIPLRPLNRFWHIFEVRSILVKIVIFAIFDLQKNFSSNSENRSRGRTDIPGTVLEC